MSNYKVSDIDKELVKLVDKRIREHEEIRGISERERLQSIAENAPEDTRDYIRVLYSLIHELENAYNGKQKRAESRLYDDITTALNDTAKIFPKAATVACQGVEGAYSQIACERMFSTPSIMYFKEFENVFTAVEKGLCQYGVLPIENSTAGSVNKVYDLLVNRDFHIVRSVRIKVNHNLVAKKGTKLSDIKEIYSHEQAINQCAEFLSTLNGVSVMRCANTAEAAKFVAESDRTDIAAISSSACIELYGLDCIKSAIQDSGNNHTRFICISKNLEIYPGSDKTTVKLVLPHRPGSLYKVLARIYALGINLIKLESRPIPESDFEFMFYFDLETSVYSDEFAQLMTELDDVCREFKYLGSYNEIV